MTIDDLGKIEWTLKDDQVGEHIVIVNVSDGVDYELVSFKPPITVIMVTGMAITRHEIESITDHQGWVLLYGRRKVGKTFLVRNFIEHEDHILIKRGEVVRQGEKKGCGFLFRESGRAEM